MSGGGGHEVVSRANYMFQAARLMVHLNGDGSEVGQNVASHIGDELMRLTTRQQLRLHSSIKHAICRRCHIPLVPGFNCSVRVRCKKKTDRRGRLRRGQRFQLLRCIVCGGVRRQLFMKRPSERSFPTASFDKPVADEEMKELSPANIEAEGSTGGSGYQLNVFVSDIVDSVIRYCLEQHGR